MKCTVSSIVSRKYVIYLHMCYLVLFPVEALHLVLFQLQSSLYILVIVTLKVKIDLKGRAEGQHKEHPVSLINKILPIMSV